MADRADAADASTQPGHLPERATLAELLETAELGDVEPGVGHLPGVIEVDRDLGVPLDAGHRVDHHPFCHVVGPLIRTECSRPAAAASRHTGAPPAQPE